MREEETTFQECIDSHVHLDMPAFDEDREEVIQRAHENGISQMITIGCGLPSSKAATKIAEEHPSIFAAIGVHPHDAEEATQEELDGLEKLLHESPKVVGIGEVGLDYHYMNSPKEAQQKIFRHFIRLSLKTGYPLVIHSREAEEDTLKILDEERQGQPLKGVIHCFSGSLEFAQRCLDMGFYISIPGIITFSKGLRKVVKQLPLSKLLVETDGPYLAPVPYRGRRNEPAFVLETAKKVAQTLQLPLEEVLQQTVHNTRTLFNLPDNSQNTKNNSSQA